jgi:hypothetical protein
MTRIYLIILIILCLVIPCYVQDIPYRVEYYTLYREPVKAVMYSTIIPGYGHLYNEQPEKFWIYFLGQVLSLIFYNEANSASFKLHPEKYVFPKEIMVASFIGFAVADKVDAYNSAIKINKRNGYLNVKILEYKF